MPHTITFICFSRFFCLHLHQQIKTIMRKIIDYTLRALLSIALILLAVHWDSMGLILALPLWLIWER